MSTEDGGGSADEAPLPLAIVGGGIGGLVLALCLDQAYNHPEKDDANSDTEAGDKLPIVVYESTSAYRPDAGGAIGLYANGLRVLRNLSARHPDLATLLDDVRDGGVDYLFRRWMRHDGTEVAVAREDELLGGGGDGSLGSEGYETPVPDEEGRRAAMRHRGGAAGVVTSALGVAAGPTEFESGLNSLGIRRWKLQEVLFEACERAGIAIHFNKRVSRVTTYKDESTGANLTRLHFKDGTTASASLLIGADGINSKVRNYVTNPLRSDVPDFVPEYTGVTCLMGCASVPRVRGICFPSSATTKCHACYYPTRLPEKRTGGGDGEEGEEAKDEEHEQVFQIYFPSPVERPDTWRTMTPDEARDECRALASRLREDGWDEQFLRPLESDTLTGVLRVGLRRRDPLDCWHVGSVSGAAPAVLLGDAAHPPVPYIGQGAQVGAGVDFKLLSNSLTFECRNPQLPQMAMEDAGTLSLVLARYCPLLSGALDLGSFGTAMEAYESLRVERCRTILGASVELGRTQQRRADSPLYNAWRELTIKAQVWAHGTLPVMRPGAAFDYEKEAMGFLRGVDEKEG